jgi:hypothetical protein
MDANLLHQEEFLRENADKLKFPGRMLMKNGPNESYVGVTVAVAGVLFFKGAHTPEVREAVCQCFDEFESLARSELKWLWRDEPPQGPDKFAYAKAPALREMVKRMDEDDYLGFLYHNGKQAIDAGDWTFEVTGHRGWEAKMGNYGPDSMRFSMPLLYVIENRIAFQAMFVSFANKLKAVHGYGGYSLMLSGPREYENEAFEAWLAPQANGLDVGYPLFVAEHVENKIKTVSWLTAINNDMLKEIGGVSALQSELPMDWFAYYPYSNGVVIQAGPKPNAAGIKTDPKPATYVLPNMLLKPLRTTSITSFHSGSVNGEPKLNGNAAQEWMERFDVPESEVFNYKVKLLNEPKLTKETTLPDRL